MTNKSTNNVLIGKDWYYCSSSYHTNSNDLDSLKNHDCPGWPECQSTNSKNKYMRIFTSAGLGQLKPAHQSSLSKAEKRVMDATVEVMDAIRDLFDGYPANFNNEAIPAVHVLQQFARQHWANRIAPDSWGEWQLTEKEKQDEEGRVRYYGF